MAKTKTKILVVEDEKFLLELYQIKLEQEGYQAFGASNGNLGFIVAQKELPDLILLDILMPEIDGFDTLRKIKSNLKTKNIPVIIFSNLSQKDEIEKGLKLGANDFIIKTSITPSELVKKVKQVLKNN